MCFMEWRILFSHEVLVPGRWELSIPYLVLKTVLGVFLCHILSLPVHTLQVFDFCNKRQQ